MNHINQLCHKSFVRWESANTIFGRTRNPYDTNRIAGGSSGGEACLLVRQTASVDLNRMHLITGDRKCQDLL